MKIIQIQLYVLLWCQAAETLDQLADLGQNVTINCDLDDEDVYWILLTQSDSPTVILRSFSNPTLAFHFHKTLKNKYSVQSKHRLVIYNVTVDEFGVYYCMNTDTPPKLSHSTRLNILVLTEPTQPTELSNHQNETQWQFIIIISALVNAGLIIVVIVVSCYSGERLKRHAIDLQQTKRLCLEQPEELSPA
ncbi:hypothetical protein E1301_Tti022471 [Triplophysa tibetana]|uniref:Immunoglobulin domain-containing protein n=1 Tax=Triplophysa tibetana TaxID=1572043 RepID=A0A5A9NRQ3_9TELE|nr:hypothetical protein E1301_Tti022471 [Triplophysa tibetana]